MAMNYDEAVNYLATTIGFGINPGLERIRVLCKALGHPQRAYPVVQITGSNGKTSTARFLTSILHGAGHKVGTFTSPHLSLYTERICVDSVPMTKGVFGEMLEELLPLMDKVNQSSHPAKVTHFEILTVMACEYFRRSGCGVGVFEVGMGGRWDATSVAVPKVSIVTNVALEHTDRLGTTLTAIATEKSFVIKEGTKAVVGRIDPEILGIFESGAAGERASVVALGRDFDYEITAGGVGLGSLGFRVRGLYGTYDDLDMPLLGEHQIANATLALVAAEAFLGSRLPETVLADGLGATASPGRLEVVGRRPTIVLDGAHNPHAIHALMEALESRLSLSGRRGKFVVVLSVLSDKDVKGMLDKLAPADLVIVTSNVSERAADPSEVGAVAEQMGLKVMVEPLVDAALELAVEEATPGGLIAVTGSLYLIGPARELLVKQEVI